MLLPMCTYIKWNKKKKKEKKKKENKIKSGGKLDIIIIIR